MTNISSPCKNACNLDRGEVSKFCSGCGRSEAEISTWLAMTNRERSKVISALKRRSMLKLVIGGKA